MSNGKVTNSRAVIQKEPRELNKKNPGKTYLPRFLDETDVGTLKSSVDRELADISMYMEKERQITSKIIPGSTYKGTWDACSGKYPEHGDENSTWDVIVTCGSETTFDGKVWKQGQQLIYLSASDIYVQRTNPAIDGMKHEVEVMKVEVDNAKAKIEENKLAIADTNFSLAETKKELESKVNENTSKITQTNQTVTDLTQTVATNVTQLRSEFKSADTALDGKLTGNINKVAADLTVTNKTVADNQTATSQSITNLQSNFNGQIAGINQSLSTTANKVGVLESKWTVRADVNGKISGIEMVNNGRQSEFTIQTDKFKVTDGTSTTIPFTIEGGKTTMNNAVVRGHLEAQSGSFKGAISASTITGSQITGNNIRGGDLNINDNAIIYSDGRAVLKNADVSGAIRATSGEFNNVTIHENCTFLGTVTAQKIVGDVVRTYALSLGSSVVVPAMPFNRTVACQIVVASGSGTSTGTALINGGSFGSVSASAYNVTAGVTPTGAPIIVGVHTSSNGVRSTTINANQQVTIGLGGNAHSYGAVSAIAVITKN